MSKKSNHYVDEKLDDLPAGLVRTVGRIIASSRGEENAISRGGLLEAVRRLPGLGEVEDRQVRKAIETLRSSGVLIGNMSNGDGYFLISTPEEYARFRAVYAARAYAVLDVVRHMDHTAEAQFGQQAGAYQPGLL